MKLTLLAHAALWIEHGSTAVLVDPWLQGTCYQSAWAHLLAPEDLVARLSRPRWVLYSHEHPDHLHVPTLQALVARFGHDLPILVPRTPLPRVARALAAMGLTGVREIPLGGTVALGDGLEVDVQGVRADDAVLVFRAGGRSIVNANDCRLEGRVLEWVARRAGQPDVYLGQFSAADGYPARLDGLEPGVAAAARWDAWHTFHRQARALGARRAIPTASFVRFAHEDNAPLNDFALGLDEVRAAAAADPAVAILHPGDGWSADGGIEQSPEHRARYEAALAAVRAGHAPRARREPVPPRGALEAAAGERFDDMLRALPGWLRRRMDVLGFHLDDDGRSLVVDWPRGRVRWIDGAPAVAHYRLGAGLFAQLCTDPWGWSDLHIGGRFTAHRWRDSGALSAFLPVSVLYALGYLSRPRRALLAPRALAGAWARRGEIRDLVGRVRTGGGGDRSSFPRL
jgi:L-ascorbate metabolism protein UlaG (beta-lactamase superfamily)